MEKVIGTKNRNHNLFWSGVQENDANTREIEGFARQLYRAGGLGLVQRMFMCGGPMSPQRMLFHMSWIVVSCGGSPRTSCTCDTYTAHFCIKNLWNQWDTCRWMRRDSWTWCTGHVLSCTKRSRGNPLVVMSSVPSDVGAVPTRTAFPEQLKKRKETLSGRCRYRDVTTLLVLGSASVRLKIEGS